MALVHYRPNFTCKQQYGPSNQNEMRWECAEHEGCDRKIRIVKDGAQMKISISGDHTGEPRNLKRVRFPPHIEQYILDAASRGENASHVLAHALEEYPEFADRLTKTRVQNLISSLRTRRDGIPRIANLFELDNEFAEHRITPAVIQSVKNNNPLPSKIVHLETNFESRDFACALSSTARCFYHFSKNLRDNKKRLGAAFELVERCIFPLHISTNDDLYHLLADALVDEARAASADAGQYLEATLNTDRYGYPNIAITAEGLRGNQVVNNIVEAVNSIMSKALDGESFDVGMFVREAILIMRSMKKSSPQCFISRPTPVIMREYHPEMQQQGTDIFGRKDFREVTNLVSSRIDISEETQCFLFTGHNFGSSGATSFAATRINQYLDAALLGEFGEGNMAGTGFPGLPVCPGQSLFTPESAANKCIKAPVSDSDQLRVHDVLQRFYCYHLVTVFSSNTQDVDVSCTCKENRDWSLCKHGYCAEAAVKTKLR
ncbi:hypothetical protein FOZ60_016912 [Perkinsus olseni]|uniref:SWIM-type domain-containing protein n=1 Tax=Perkinsus olseni TaxID=32597 RepID=A0A7J6N2M0_PEROL|nr:hypothetical protein FOZ60_016912 [Perkinsus olseni]